MFLRIRRGVINGGQWGPVNDEQAEIVSANVLRLAVAVAKEVAPEAEVETIEVQESVTFGSQVSKARPGEDDPEWVEMCRKQALIIDIVSERMRDSELWRADFDPRDYLREYPIYSELA